MSTLTTMNGGEMIAHVLQAQGVKHIFTLCGGHVSPILIGAETLGIRVFDTRNEATAVFAADAVGRLTGRPGVAVVTAGPGVTNSVTALKNAQMAQSPLILLGGAAATLLQGRGALQDIDQLSLVNSLVKWSSRIKTVREIIPALEKAFKVAMENVPGPVFLEFPIDILYPESLVKEWYGLNRTSDSLKGKLKQWYINRHAKSLFVHNETIKFSTNTFKATFVKPDSQPIKKAKKLVKKSKKPLLILGSGAMQNPDATEKLVSAIEQINIPVYLSGMARGLLGANHQLHIRHKRREAIKDSDLILLAGVSNDFRLDYGNHIGNRRFIGINRSKADLALNKKPTLGILGDPNDFLQQLSLKYKFEDKIWIEKLKAKDKARDTEINEQSEQIQSGLNPIRALQLISNELPDNAVLVADGGDFVATASYVVKISQPLSWLDPGAFGTLGVGAGFALGAAAVYPDRPIYILYGDGSAGYSLMEFDTFARHKLPVTAIIGNDGCWSQIARDQIEILGSDTAVMLEKSDYQNVALAFGVESIKVTDLKTLRDAMEKAKSLNNMKQPFLINMHIDQSDFRKGSISV